MSQPRFLMDENMPPALAEALRRADPAIDIATVRELGLLGIPDDELVAYAAEEGRIIVSQDVHTLGGEAERLIRAGLAMPGLLLIPQDTSLQEVTLDLLLIAGASEAEEWEGLIRYLLL